MRKLTEQQRKTLELLVTSGLTEGFYLTGGTALVIRHAHRISEDFDFFSYPDAGDFTSMPFLKKLQVLKGDILTYQADTIRTVINGIHCSWFKYPYKLLRPPEKVTIGGRPLELARDEDIAASKVIAICQRGAKKDFFDLHFLMEKHGLDLYDIFKLLREKYSLDDSWFAIPMKALVYFDDCRNEEVRIAQGVALDEASWKRIEYYFKRQVKNLIKFEHEHPLSSKPI